MATTKKFLSNQTKTYEGAPAYLDLTPEQKLRRSVLSCLLWEREAYESGDTIANRIKTFIPLVNVKVVSDLAIEAREQMHLRHVPLLIVREMARQPLHKILVAQTLERIIQRADEITEFLSLYWADGRQPLSNQVKKGIGRAFYKFNEYQFAKYNRNETVKFRDALFLSHPKARNDEEDVLWKKIIADGLAVPETWEARAASGMDKKENFENLLRENKLGALALLRNLRNMVQVGISETIINEAIQKMNTERVLPYRFIAAQRNCHSTAFKPYLEAGMFKCLAGHPKMEGRTALLIDVSGSMGAVLSEKSDLARLDAASGLAVLLREVCEDIVIYTFSDKAKKVQDGHGFDLIDKIDRNQTHGCTYLGAAVKTVNQAEKFDRFIVITDEQSFDAVGSPKGMGYLINVASARNGVGYGVWNHIDGFSENVVKYIIEYEKEFVNKQLKNEITHLVANQLINDNLKGIIISGTELPEGDALFLDYQPPQDDRFIQQAEVIKYYVKKKIPIFLYDKTLSVKPDEAEWLKRQRVKLYEPALKYREGFKYLPLFCPVLHTLSTIKLNKDDPRPVSVGFKGDISDRLKSFEKYYVETGKNYPAFTIQYNDSTGLEKSKVDSYVNFNVTENKDLKYKDMKSLVLLGSYFDYSVGYLPDIFTPLSQNVIILLPEEHRYYHSLFSDTIIRSITDIAYHMESYDFTYIGYISSIYERIEKHFPEMKLNWTLGVIKEELGL